MTTLNTKFDLGQTVWKIGRRYETFSLPCRFCRGARLLRVEAPSGAHAYVTCPECKGQGHLRLGGVPKFEVIGEDRIGKIEVTLIDPSVPGFNGGADWLERDAERYMVSGTGFPSGTVYYQIDLFASPEEAETECEERNERLVAGEVPEQWKPSRELYHAARAFLEHRDVYEHNDEHVTRAEAIVAAFEYEPELQAAES